MYVFLRIESSIRIIYYLTGICRTVVEEYLYERVSRVAVGCRRVESATRSLGVVFTPENMECHGVRETKTGSLKEMLNENQGAAGMERRGKKKKEIGGKAVLK